MPGPLPTRIEDSPHYQRIAAAVAAIRAEEVEPEIFEEFLRAELGLCRERAAAIFSHAREQHMNPKELDHGMAGLSHVGAGLEQMLSWCTDRDPSHLDLGMERLREGFQHILQATLMHPRGPDDDLPPAGERALPA